MGDSHRAALEAAWLEHRDRGFLLADPDDPIETRTATDDATGVEFRFRWLPHRELRGNTSALEARGILDPDRDRNALFSDPRDPFGRHCFLCPDNIEICHPAERLIPIDAAGRRWWAGVNFAWVGHHHFTVISDRHTDQIYSFAVLAAMLELHRATAGAFRVVYNAPDAGATIPWHLHLQIIGDPFPIEAMAPGSEVQYPTAVKRHAGSEAEAADRWIGDWLRRDEEHHRINILVAGPPGNLTIFTFPRDTRRSHASNKGLMGGFEVAGAFAYSEPDRRSDFDTADVSLARAALGQIRPSSWPM